MNNEEANDIFIEALEIFINHILFARDIYPAQIFKKRRIYNTPVYISIYPPLNAYIYKVLCSARELSRSGELQRVDMIVYRNEMQPIERYNFDFCVNQSVNNQHNLIDEFLISFEEQLRFALYTLSERTKSLKKLAKDIKFKILLHTTQTGFVRLSHNPNYQEFPWLHESERSEPEKNEISLLPLTCIQSVGLQITAEIF